MEQIKNELEKISNHHYSIENENLFTEVQEKFNKLKCQINKEFIEDKIKTVEKWYEETSKSFEHAIDSKINFLFDLSFDNLIPSKASSESILELGTLTEALTLECLDPEYILVDCQESFTVHLNNNFLEISQPSPIGKMTINYNQLKNVDTIYLSLGFEVHHIGLFSYLWAKPTAPQKIIIQISPGRIRPEVINALFVDPRPFSDIVIDMRGILTSDEEKKAQNLKSILSKASNLKRLSILLSGSDSISITFQNIQLTNSQNIEELVLDLHNTEVQDKDMSNMLCSLCNIRRFDLDACNTKITDKSLDMLGKNALSGMEHLENFRLCLWKTNITDKGVLSFISYLRNLKVFYLNLSFTSITDEAVQQLAKVLSNFSDTLEYFCLALSGTSISDESFSQVFQPMPKVKYFYIMLSETVISDKSLNSFTQKTLPSLMNVETLGLNLCSTLITDDSFYPILSYLDNIKCLEIKVSFTKITDFSVKHFIDEKLPRMKALESLLMDFDGTYVSQEIKDELENVIRGKENGNM